MEGVLTKEEIKKMYKQNDRLKKSMEQYYKLGLQEGRIDNEGRLRLSKEEYENW